MREREDEVLRRPEEYAEIIDNFDFYIAVRVDMVHDEKVGRLIAVSQTKGAVDGAIVADRKRHPNSVYMGWMPKDFIDKREGWVVGGEA